MKLIVVTAPTFFVEEDKIITALFEEGLDILHLRKPETPAMYAERLLTLIPEKYHRRIVTHEHFYLKEEFDLMGIHDIETMNEIRKAVNAVDPTICIYGEGWAAEAPQYPADSLAMKGNIAQIPGVAVFSDELRDGLCGPVGLSLIHI